MDDVELSSDDESANGQSEEKYDINSGEDNNSASLDMGKVISFLDFLFVYVVVYYKMIYLVPFLIQICQRIMLIL